MAQTQRALLEFPASDAAFVETLAGKLGWKVTTEGDAAENQDAGRDGAGGEIYKSEQIDWGKYSLGFSKAANTTLKAHIGQGGSNNRQRHRARRAACVHLEQMKVFLDTNVLVDFIAEREGAKDASDILQVGKAGAKALNFARRF